MMKDKRRRIDMHLTHQEMQAAARENQPMTGHLSSCDACKQAVELLRLFPMAGRIPLAQPPQAWVKRAMSIPDRTLIAPAVTRLKALLTFDSWLSPQPVGVRGCDTCSERRICCEAGPYLVDLRAEKRKDGWRMIAQLGGENAEQAELSTGRMTIPADRGALFQWSSSRPPGAIHIRVGEQEIELPKLSWKRSRRT
jgi:hypothetical protein